jgi:RNA polymerase sigma-70 factor (ECF subfamily)
MRRARMWGETRAEVIAELVQDVYLKLCADNGRLLQDFQPEHPDAFCGYLKVVAANLVSDYFKSSHTDKRGGRAEAVPIEKAEQAPAQCVGRNLSACERDLLLQELDTLLRESLHGETAARDRTIFWLHYRNGMTAAAIAALPAFRMNVKSVESVIHRVTRALRDQVGAEWKQEAKRIGGR